jgi:hypothetical protein
VVHATHAPRGKDITYKLIYPDGREQILLSAKYDFNWQLASRESRTSGFAGAPGPVSSYRFPRATRIVPEVEPQETPDRTTVLLKSVTAATWYSPGGRFAGSCIDLRFEGRAI